MTNNNANNAEVLRNVDKTLETGGRVGGEVHLYFRIQKGTDHRGQERVVFRKKKETCMGGWINNNVEEKVFANEDQLVEFLKDRWYDRVVADELADAFGDELGFKAEDIMYPVERVAKEIQELDKEGKIDLASGALTNREHAIQWMEQEYPDHFADPEAEA